MVRIPLDKYYTPKEVAKHCVETAFNLIGESNITNIIEPSAGAGVFLNFLPPDKTWAFDIKPDVDEVNGIKIEQADFLTLGLSYWPGRLIIGNPPFGSNVDGVAKGRDASGRLAWRFIRTCTGLGDYIAFILPIGQLNTETTLYGFDLVHSEDLGEQVYSDIVLHCCFNIYMLPSDRTLNKGWSKIKHLDDVTVRTFRVEHMKKDEDYGDWHYIIPNWGNCNKRLTSIWEKNQCIAIRVNNKNIKDEVLSFMAQYDWNNHKKHISVASVTIRDIVNALRENIKGIK